MALTIFKNQLFFQYELFTFSTLWNKYLKEAEGQRLHSDGFRGVRKGHMPPPPPLNFEQQNFFFAIFINYYLGNIC